MREEVAMLLFRSYRRAFTRLASHPWFWVFLSVALLSPLLLLLRFPLDDTIEMIALAWVPLLLMVSPVALDESTRDESLISTTLSETDLWSDGQGTDPY